MKRVPVIAGLTIVHALCTALMYPPANIWPLALVAVAPLIGAVMVATRAWQLWLGVGVVQFALWLWMQRWTAGITQAGFAPLALYCAIWPTLFAVILYRVRRHRRFAQLPMAVLGPVLWIGIEFLRGAVLFYGYPWFLLGYPMVEWPVLAQSADLLGTYFLGFLAAAFGGLVVDIVRWRYGELTARSTLIAGSIVIALFVTDIGYGWWRMNQSDVLRPGPVILSVQTNLPQDNRNAWTAEMQANDLPGFMELTRQGLAQADVEVDLIAWPETMVPGVGFEQDVVDLLAGFGEQAQYMYRWPMEVDAFAHQLGIAMLIGAPAWEGPRTERVDGMIELRPPEHRYNSAYLVTGRPPYQRYDKYFLTPFGETMPYISAWPWLEQKMLAVGAEGMRFDLSAASSIETLKFSYDEQTIGLGTPICFEDCMSRTIRRMVYADGGKRADVLVNLSNDGWFTWDDGTRAQRAQISRLRCIENRVPLVRSVNTGMSVHVDSRGNLIDVIGDGRYGSGNIAGSLVAQTSLDSRHTLYGHIGDIWGWLCLAALGGLTIVALRRPNVR